MDVLLGPLLSPMQQIMKQLYLPVLPPLAPAMSSMGALYDMLTMLTMPTTSTTSTMPTRKSHYMRGPTIDIWTTAEDADGVTLPANTSPNCYIIRRRIASHNLDDMQAMYIDPHDMLEYFRAIVPTWGAILCTVILYKDYVIRIYPCITGRDPHPVIKSLLSQVVGQIGAKGINLVNDGRDGVVGQARELSKFLDAPCMVDPGIHIPPCKDHGLDSRASHKEKEESQLLSKKQREDMCEIWKIESILTLNALIKKENITPGITIMHKVDGSQIPFNDQVHLMVRRKLYPWVDELIK